MDKRVVVSAAAALAFGTALAADGQVGRKAGLWEVTNNMQMEGMKMPDMPDMSKIPPEMRQQMEKMMAEKGLSMKGQGVRYCLSKEAAARDDPPMKDDARCQPKIGKRTATSMAYTFTCPEGSGEGEVNFAGNDSYSGWMKFQGMGKGMGPGAGGGRMEFTAKWLGADCGGLKSQ